jgi:hypothetical protein
VNVPSGMVSITDEVRVCELEQRVTQGEALNDEEVDFLIRYLDHHEPDLCAALSPGWRLWKR